jgi:hypothetical protein
MAAEYLARYGKPADMVLGKRWSASELDVAQPKSIGTVRSCTRLIWAGKYLRYYSEPLVMASRVLRDDPNLAVSIDIYGQDAPGDRIVVPGRLEYRGPFRDQDLARILREYDFGLLTYSFDANTQGYMRLSFPTKLVDYLSCALPVLAIAPERLWITREVRDRGVGLVLTSADEAAVRSLFMALPGIATEQYAVWSERALAWARDEHGREEACMRLRTLLA